MPLFSFVCEKCKAESEILVRGEEAPVCPTCGSSRLVKQASAFAAVGGGHSGGSMPAGCQCCSSRKAGTCPKF